MIKPIRLVVADDAVELRTLVVRLLGRNEDIDVVGQAGDSPATIAIIEKLRPDVLLLDLSMPGAGGLGVLEELRARGFDVKIVVLSGLPAASTAQACLDAGASAYVEKGTVLSELATVIREVAAR
jgi:two-component system invasion response regulator UvrY